MKVTQLPLHNQCYQSNSIDSLQQIMLPSQRCTASAAVLVLLSHCKLNATHPNPPVVHTPEDSGDPSASSPADSDQEDQTDQFQATFDSLKSRNWRLETASNGPFDDLQDVFLRFVNTDHAEFETKCLTYSKLSYQLKLSEGMLGIEIDIPEDQHADETGQACDDLQSLGETLRKELDAVKNFAVDGETLVLSE